MDEILVKYRDTVTSDDGATWTPEAVGEERDDGLWVGWLQFTAVGDARSPLHSPRETTQPNRADLLYWASGLSHAYLEGSLTRALAETSRPHGDAAVDAPRATPAAPRPGATPTTQSATAPPHHAVLDPFAVYAEGADLLADQLRALSADQLRAIVREYALTGAAGTALDGATAAELRALIASEVAGSADG